MKVREEKKKDFVSDIALMETLLIYGCRLLCDEPYMPRTQAFFHIWLQGKWQWWQQVISSYSAKVEGLNTV